MKYAWLLLLLLSVAGELQAGELTLAESLRLVRMNNPSLISAAHDLAIAGEEVSQAKSGYLPRIDLQGGYTAQEEAQEVRIAGRSEPTQESNYAFYDLQVEQTLYDFGRTGGRLDRARQLQASTAFDYAGIEQDVFLQTVIAYYQILAAQKLLVAAREEVGQRSDHLRVAQNLFEQGMVTRNDVLQAEVQLAASRQLQLSRENEQEDGWLRLNYLTGRAPEARDELIEEEDVTPMIASADAAAVVLDRPALKAQRLRTEARQAEVREARGEFWPRLFVKGEANYVENEYVTQQTIYSATVGFSMNLFDGFATTSRLNRAVEIERQARDRLRELSEQARLEYQTAGNDARVAEARIRVAEKSILQAEENLRINKDRYREQVGTATEVIDAQTLLTQARTDYYQAVFDHQVAVARVRHAAGQL